MTRGRRSGWIWSATLAALLLAAVPAAAVQPDEILPDRTLEARARAISAEVRCLVCQNQTIDDSDAPLARDLRLLVRERLRAGDSDPAVKDFIVGRYGAFVLLKPPFSARTLALWLGPALVLAAAGLGLALSRRRGDPAPRALTGDEEARLAAVLNSNVRSADGADAQAASRP